MKYKDMKIVQHCAQECEWQFSGEMSVYWMLTAWEWALANSKHRPDYADVLLLGEKVEPKKNANGTRRVAVRVGDDVKVDPRDVPHLLNALVRDGIDALTPEEWFREYEEIHPFVDGNGRTGNILFNWLNGTLNDPVMPPDFWNQQHRVPNQGFYRGRGW